MLSAVSGFNHNKAGFGEIQKIRTANNGSNRCNVTNGRTTEAEISSFLEYKNPYDKKTIYKTTVTFPNLNRVGIKTVSLETGNPYNSTYTAGYFDNVINNTDKSEQSARYLKENHGLTLDVKDGVVNGYTKETKLDDGILTESVSFKPKKA